MSTFWYMEVVFNSIPGVMSGWDTEPPNSAIVLLCHPIVRSTVRNATEMSNLSYHNKEGSSIFLLSRGDVPYWPNVLFFIIIFLIWTHIMRRQNHLNNVPTLILTPIHLIDRCTPPLHDCGLNISLDTHTRRHTHTHTQTYTHTHTRRRTHTHTHTHSIL